MLLIKYGPRHVINYNISRLSNALNIHNLPLLDISVVTKLKFSTRIAK